MKSVQFLSYNIHKGKSFFTRQLINHPLKNFIHNIDADIVLLQEVRGLQHQDYKKLGQHQLDILTDKKYEHSIYGKNASYYSGHHGNAILSKFSIEQNNNYDLTINHFEKRGILHAIINLPSDKIHVFCTHFNLTEKDRMVQLEMLEEVITTTTTENDKIIIGGDFSLDSIFVKNLEISHSQVIKDKKLIALSDHLPILMKINL